MLRNIHLEGEIGEKFGKVFEVDVDNFRDALRCIDCNVEGFKNYLIECDQKGVGFALEVEGRDIEDADHMLLSLEPGDMTITAVPAGSKSGGGKLLAAVAIIAAVIFFPPSAGALGLTSTATVAGVATTSLTTLGTLAVGLAINLALTGIQQLMAPDPGTDDQNQEKSYLFNGSQQNIIEGDPVPVLYGELRVPGRPISFEILNQEFVDSQDTFNFSGNISPNFWTAT